MKKIQMLTIMLMFLLLMGCGDSNPLPKEYQLVVTKTGTGTIIKSPDRAKYQEGTVVTVEAKPATGYVFSNWLGGGFDNQTSPTLTITMNSDITLKAVFEMKEADLTTYTSDIQLPKTNNSAIIKTDGFSLGRGVEDVTQLRKEVPFTVQTPNAAFSLGTAYLTREEADSGVFYMVLPATNTSAETYGFIKLSGIRYKNEAGEVILEDAVTYLYGSVGETSYDIYSDTCLLPGETGYFIGIETDITYSQVHSIEFTTVEADNEFVPAVGKFLPQKITYAQQEYGLYDKLAFQFGNEGEQKVLIEDYQSPLYILLDENDQPLLWGYSSSLTDTDVILEPGQTLQGQDGLFKYTGLATKILAINDFTDYTDPTTSTQSVNQRGDYSNLTTEERVNLRNQREMMKQLGE